MATGVQERIAVRPNEAARLIGVSRDVIFAAIAAGELRSAKCGGARLISVEALREFVESHERG